MSNDGWTLLVSGPAARGIRQLPEKYALAVVAALRAIETNPRRLGKSLRFELEGRWSARRGPYRIIYVIDDATSTITVLAVAHRADVYRRD